MGYVVVDRNGRKQFPSSGEGKLSYPTKREAIQNAHDANVGGFTHDRRYYVRKTTSSTRRKSRTKLTRQRKAFYGENYGLVYGVKKGGIFRW